MLSAGSKKKFLLPNGPKFAKVENWKILLEIFSRQLMIFFLVFLPYDCQNAWDELDDKIKENVEIVFVRNYSEIQNELFPNFPSA